MGGVPVKQEEAGLYLHVPFCRHHCGYCGFAVTEKGAADRALQRQYVEAMLRELEMRLRWHPGLAFTTLYIGGGTPSILAETELRFLFSELGHLIDFAHLREITFEANPEDLLARPELPPLLRELGATRLSVGLQTLSPQGLEALERRARPEAILELSRALPRSFAGDVCYDFILGWPGQTREAFAARDLRFLREATYHHLSIYFLNYEPGTRLERDRRLGRVKPLPEDHQVDIWESWIAAAAERGLHHYEISSFARSGHESLHNRNTWRGRPYLGAGAGAVSRVGQVRWTNLRHPPGYLKKVAAQRFPAWQAEFLTPEIRWKEDLMLSLRWKQGIDPTSFAARHGFEPLRGMEKKLAEWKKNGWLAQDSGRLRLTPAGWLLADEIITDWMARLETKP